MVLLLYKALYNLKKILLLWWKYFKSNLNKIGFITVLYKPYCIIKDKVLVFFYVDNIIFIFWKGKGYIVKEVMRELKNRY